jgi:hypothetical protein
MLMMMRGSIVPPPSVSAVSLVASEQEHYQSRPYYAPSSSIDHMGSIYKSVRTIMMKQTKNTIFPTHGHRESSATASATATSVKVTGDARQRHLDQDVDAASFTSSVSGLLTTRCFTECVEQKLTPEECQEYIEAQITAAGGHEVGGVEIDIHVPRTPDVFADSYWMVEVPVNLEGTMSCDRNNNNDSQLYYPFLWDDGSGSAADGAGSTVPDIKCPGFSAGACCVWIRNFFRDSMAYDVNRNCYSCFVNKEPLTPVVMKIADEATGETTTTTEYQDYVYVNANANDQPEGSSSCQRQQYTLEQVEALDDLQRQKMTKALVSLETFATNNGSDSDEYNGIEKTCSRFDFLLEELYDAAVGVKALSQAVGELACQFCAGALDAPLTEIIMDMADMTDMTDNYDTTDNALSDSNSHPLVMKVAQLLQLEIQSSATNQIIIYANDQNEIVEVPKLGGSRAADEEYDTINDCEDVDEDENNLTDRMQTCIDTPALCTTTQYCDNHELSEGHDVGIEPKYECRDYASAGGACGGNTDYLCNPNTAFCVGASSGGRGDFPPNFGGGGGDFPPFEGGGGDFPTFDYFSRTRLEPEQPKSGVCRTICDSDNDSKCASENAWCALEGFDYDYPRVCLPFGETGSKCNVFVFDPTEETRCNPQTHYCRDTWYCILPDVGGRCAELGRGGDCLVNGDCENENGDAEFCDTLIHRCKPNYKYCDCCLLDANTCEEGTKCGTGDQEEAGGGGRGRNLRHHTTSITHQHPHHRERLLEDPETIDMLDSIDDFGNAAICRPTGGIPHPP